MGSIVHEQCTTSVAHQVSLSTSTRTSKNRRCKNWNGTHLGIFSVLLIHNTCRVGQNIFFTWGWFCSTFAILWISAMLRLPGTRYLVLYFPTQNSRTLRCKNEEKIRMHLQVESKRWERFSFFRWILNKSQWIHIRVKIRYKYLYKNKSQYSCRKKII